MINRTPYLGPVLIGLLFAAATAAAEPPGDVKNGKLVYQRYCVSCHGVKGNGQGDFAEWIVTKPRDYRQGMYKWRSTPSESLPTDADLERVLVNGLYGTYMPSWNAIDRQSRRDVIAYIKTFSSRFAEEKPAAPITIPPDPGYSDESVARGRDTYVKLECAKCHGDQGQGDGPKSHELKDDWGQVSVPYDMTQGHLKGGNTGADIYRVFITGLSGTPMPSFADSISTPQAWDLVHYIQSLSPAYQKNSPSAAGGRR